MRRTYRPVTALAAALLVATSLLSAVFVVAVPTAAAQDVGDIVNELERNGYYIESGGEGSDSSFQDLVRQGERAQDNWYFLSMADTVPEDFADDLFGRVSPRGNVLVYFIDGDGFVNVQLASDRSEAIETRALAPFDEDWNQPEDFMADVVTEFDRQIAGSSSTSSGSTSTNPSSDSGGGGFPWLLVGIPVVFIGGLWFMNRRGKQKKADDTLETAQKIRAELQKELDELANDVLVLSGPVDLSDKPQVIEYYREATDTYLTISDEMPDGENLETANLRQLSEIGTRVAHARWQMDAAEAIMDGEPVPEKPKLPPPPAPKKPAPRPDQRRQQMPQRQPRPRVPYSRSRSRNSGGLLDILIAGAGMMGTRRGGGMFGRSRGGGMFGGSSRSRSSGATQSTPRRGGGVFGGGSNSRSSSRSTSRSSSRSSTRRSGNRRSTSRRRRRGSSGGPS